MPWWVILILVSMSVGTVVDALCLWLLLRTHFKHDGESTV
jgi:hypothetical protein